MYNGFLVTDSMRNNKKYDGNTIKFGITVDNENYIVKLPKDSISSIYSEHIASRFIKNLGIPCHETWIGMYNGIQVVILKDFTSELIELKSYESTRQSSEGTDIKDKVYTYKDVTYMIEKHTKMSDRNKQMAINRFWQMFICDAILGNRDRHRGNWGYLVIKNNNNKIYKPAPLYDNGASLFPDISNIIDSYRSVIGTDYEYKFIEERSERFPASLFKMERANGDVKRTNYYEMLGDLRVSKTLAYNVKTLKNNIGMNGVYESIIRVVAQVRNIVPYEFRRFYIIITCTRYGHIIERKSIRTSYNWVISRLRMEDRQW